MSRVDLEFRGDACRTHSPTPPLSHLITSDMNFPHHYMALVQIDTHNTDDHGSKRGHDRKKKRVNECLTGHVAVGS